MYTCTTYLQRANRLSHQTPKPPPEETLFRHRRAVRCCQDDSPTPEESDVWTRSHAECPFSMEQMWTGELPAAPIDAPSGYTGYPGRECLENNEFIEDFIESNAQACADACSANPDCRSFDLSATACRLSSSCNHYSLTEPATTRTWYFKHYDIQPVGYSMHDTGGCASQNDLAENVQGLTVQECANLCSADSSCVSFAYRKLGSAAVWGCSLSTTCSDLSMTVNDPDDPMNVYFRNDNNDEDEECLFMTYGHAEVRRSWAVCFCECLSRLTQTLYV